MDQDPTSQPLAESSRLSDDLEADVDDSHDLNEPASPGVESSAILNDFSYGTVSSVEDVQKTSLSHPADGTIEDNADESDAPDTPVIFTVIEGATKKGRGMLVSSHGYSHTVKQGNGQTTHLRCTKRNGSVDCRAIVTQKGELYQPGFHSHCHPPELAASLQARVSV
ncbi:Hypp705 [Branchiostoma lanceolatum]|uniref:Hypp705 protein n=1 Tax=Branchiostoma lanceolatum TaxID=7740 RepID=A0A8J9VNH5_BRALA|nr:Hypp705 [Branchiostoma lanceolatum]